VETETTAAEVVYLIGGKDTGHTKIGRAADASRRLRGIQTTSPYRLEVLWTHPGGAKLEAEFHRHFSDRHVSGEWFDFGSAEAAKELVSAALPDVLSAMEERPERLAAQKAQREADRLATQEVRWRQMDALLASGELRGSSGHLNPGLTVRPSADALARAQALLGERSLEMGAFITSCLAAVAADPDGFLDRLGEHWPAPKRRGRPPRDAAGNSERPAPSGDRASDAADPPAA
jgi:hypothetical protein